MTKKVKHPIKHKEAKLLEDRIVLSNREILFSDIKFFFVEENFSSQYYFFLPLLVFLTAIEFITMDFYYELILINVFPSFFLSFFFNNYYGKKNLSFFLKNNKFVSIDASGYKKLIAQFRAIWENHDINKLKKLNNWANKEIEMLNESLVESKKKNNENNFPIDLKFTKWYNQNILQTLKLRSIFNAK